MRPYDPDEIPGEKAPTRQACVVWLLLFLVVILFWLWLAKEFISTFMVMAP